MSSRLPPESFFAPVVRPWVEPEKPKVRRRRISTGEQAAFNPVLLTKEQANGLNGHAANGGGHFLQEEEPHNLATREKSMEGPAAKRFKRVSVPPEKRTSPGKASAMVGAKWEAVIDDARIRMEKDEADKKDAWEGANAMTFVALYTLMHARVYETEVTLTPTNRVAAASMVKRLLTTKFSNDTEKFSWFVAWVWGDEAKRWASSKGSRRMSWKWCFTNEKFDDWQASMRKKKDRAKERELTDVGRVRA